MHKSHTPLYSATHVTCVDVTHDFQFLVLPVPPKSIGLTIHHKVHKVTYIYVQVRICALRHITIYNDKS